MGCDVCDPLKKSEDAIAVSEAVKDLPGIRVKGIMLASSWTSFNSIHEGLRCGGHRSNVYRSPRHMIAFNSIHEGRHSGR